MIHEISTTTQLIQKISAATERSRHTAAEQAQPIDFKELDGIFADQETDEKKDCLQTSRRLGSPTQEPVPFKDEKDDGENLKDQYREYQPAASMNTQDFLTHRTTASEAPNSLSPRPVVPPNKALSAYAAIAGFQSPEQEGLLTLLLEYFK